MSLNLKYQIIVSGILCLLAFSKCQTRVDGIDFKNIISQSWQLRGEQREAFLKENILLADSLNHEDGRVRTRYFLGFFYESFQKFELANAVYLELLDLTQELDNSEWEASTLIQLGQTHIYQGEYLEAEAFLIDALDKSELQSNPKLKGYTYSALGLLYERKSEIGRAISVYQNALDVFRNTLDTTMQIKTLNYLGIQYAALDLSDLSSSSYEKAAKLALSKKDSAQYISSLYQSGINLIKNGEYDKALILSLKAEGLFSQSMDSAKYARILNNIGDAYLGLYSSQRDSIYFDSAFHFMNESLRIKTKINDKKGRAFTLFNLGKLFSKFDVEKSEKYFSEAFEIWRKDKNSLNLSKIAIELVELYLPINLNESNYYLTLTDSLSRQFDNLSQKARIMGLRASIASLSNDLSSYKLYIDKRDSLLSLDGSQKRQKFVAAAEVRLRTLELEKEKELLLETNGLQEDIADFRKLLLVIAIVFLIVIILFLAYSIRKNRNLVHLNERIVNLKNGILHNQFNSFELLRAIFRLEEREAVSSENKSLLTEVNTKIGSLTGLSRILYKEQLKNYAGTSMIDLKEYLESIVPDSMQLNNEDLDYHLSIDSITVKSDVALSIGLVVNELCINYIKHAIPNGADQMSIELNELNEKINLHYTDNADLGNQINEGTNTYSKLVTSLVQDLKGTIITNSAKGIEYKIEIPIKK